MVLEKTGSDAIILLCDLLAVSSKVLAPHAQTPQICLCHFFLLSALVNLAWGLHNSASLTQGLIKLKPQA